MGQVFAAYDPRLDRQVAVKLLRHDVPAVENQPLRLRLEREAQALARLAHPNVVAVHDLGDHGDGLFMALLEITRYDLARVRWHDKKLRAQSVEQVKAVRAAFKGRGEHFKPYVTECDEWLAKHPPR